MHLVGRLGFCFLFFFLVFGLFVVFLRRGRGSLCFFFFCLQAAREREKTEEIMNYRPPFCYCLSICPSVCVKSSYLLILCSLFCISLCLSLSVCLSLSLYLCLCASLSPSLSLFLPPPTLSLPPPTLSFSSSFLLFLSPSDHSRF